MRILDHRDTTARSPAAHPAATAPARTDRPRPARYRQPASPRTTRAPGRAGPAPTTPRTRRPRTPPRPPTGPAAPGPKTSYRSPPRPRRARTIPLPRAPPRPPQPALRVRTLSRAVAPPAPDRNPSTPRSGALAITEYRDHTQQQAPRRVIRGGPALLLRWDRLSEQQLDRHACVGDNGEVRLARRQTAEVVPDRLPERVPIAVGCYCCNRRAM